MKNIAKYVVGSLVGAFAIHGAVVACSGGDETKDANAGFSCSRYEYTLVDSRGFEEVGTFTKPNGAESTIYRLPEGWEPLPQGQYDDLLLRRCAQ